MPAYVTHLPSTTTARRDDLGDKALRESHEKTPKTVDVDPWNA